jgi:hypothetical protein
MKEFLQKEGDFWVVKNDTPLYTEALRIFYEMWGVKKLPFFPGPQPISIERKHFQVLRSGKYVVCEKTDGTRIALLAFTFQSKKVTLMINRALKLTHVALNLPRSAHKGTLIDGELVGKRLMIYDGVYVSGEDLKGRDLLTRLEITGQFIKGIMRLAKDPIIVRLKKFSTLEGLAVFQKEVISKLDYETDGLVFTPVFEPIRIGTHETMFKWKPRDKNTIDFQVKWSGDRCCLYVQEKGVLIFESEITKDRIDDSFAEWLVDGAIVECTYMIKDRPLWWKPIGLRTDKTYPNNRRTFYRTIVNVKEDIQWEEFTRL